MYEQVTLQASVEINKKVKASIESGFVVLLGISSSDVQEDIDYLVKKIINLRVFSDDQGLMNKSILDTGEDILVISQFTLYADTKKGNRPSFINAAKPQQAIDLYHSFIKALENQLNKEVRSGEFGADMKVKLINDGPVTIIMDSKNKEL